MEVDSACALINQLIYKPGWSFHAEPHTPRFEGAIKVNVTYPAFDSGSNANPEAWRNGYAEEIAGGARASFPIIVADCEDDCALYRRLLERIMVIEEHEAREFLRVLPTGWSPFHPHRVDGMKRWGALDHDLLFGVA